MRYLKYDEIWLTLFCFSGSDLLFFCISRYGNTACSYFIFSSYVFYLLFYLVCILSYSFMWSRFSFIWPFEKTARERSVGKIGKLVSPVAYREGGLGGSNPPPPKFRNFDKVPKINKIVLYEMKFVVPNYSCPQNPWLGGHCPQIPVISFLNWICWTPPRIKFLGTPLSITTYCRETESVKGLKVSRQWSLNLLVKSDRAESKTLRCSEVKVTIMSVQQ
jgi:hypothetical protein